MSCIVRLHLAVSNFPESSVKPGTPLVDGPNHSEKIAIADTNCIENVEHSVFFPRTQEKKMK